MLRKVQKHKKNAEIFAYLEKYMYLCSRLEKNIAEWSSW